MTQEPPVETSLTWLGRLTGDPTEGDWKVVLCQTFSSVDDRVAPAGLIEKLQDGQDVPEEFVDVGAADRQDDPGVIAFLTPPSNCQIFIILAIVGDDDPRFLQCKR